MKIPSYHAVGKPWTEREDMVVLGLPEELAATRIFRTVRAIQARRRALSRR